MSPTTTISPVDLDEPSGPEDKLGKRERNKLDKRRRIVEAATELFQEKGFDDTTTAEIATKAGIGAGTLYLYVDSKEDLLVSVFETVAGDAWSQAFERVDPAAPLVEQIMGLFLHVTDHHEPDQRLAKSFFKELPWLELPARQGADDFVRNFLQGIEDVLLEASRNGRLDPEVPRTTLASNLYALWAHLMRRHIGERLSYDDMITQLTASFDLALWGMTPDRASAGSGWKRVSTRSR